MLLNAQHTRVSCPFADLQHTWTNASVVEGTAGVAAAADLSRVLVRTSQAASAEAA